METRRIETICRLCGSRARTSEHRHLGFTSYRCSQCGDIYLSHLFLDSEVMNDTIVCHKLAAMVTEWNLTPGNPKLLIAARDSSTGLSSAEITVVPYRQLLARYPLTPQDVYDRSLINLGRLADRRGSTATLAFERFTPLGVFFASGETQFDVVNAIVATILSLEKSGVVNFTLCHMDVSSTSKGLFNTAVGVSITPEGWDRICFLEDTPPPEQQPLQAFVSMWNDRDRALVYEKGIKPAVESAHAPVYRVRPYRLESTPLDRASLDQAFSSIRDSVYLVADVTGTPPSVFHEAGFAQGIGLPVIWAVDRHYSQDARGMVAQATDSQDFHILEYATPTDLAEKLRVRLQSTIQLDTAQPVMAQ